MKRIQLIELKPGMILAEPVLNSDGTIELLARGNTIQARHIEMMMNLGVFDVVVFEDADQFEPLVSPSLEEQAALVAKMAEERGLTFDTKAYLESLQNLEVETSEVMVSPFNQNMEIHVLTGEGNVPIDQKHKGIVQETRQLFEKLKVVEEIDYVSVKSNVAKLLPDMIRNNDVLMRLQQLQETDDYTFQHSLRVSVMASMIGKWLGYSKGDLEDIATAGLLFDIGKMKVPEFVLNKHGAVSTDEFEVIKKHPQFGYTVLLRTKGVSQNVKFATLQHHERIDGSGYPLRIRGGQIHEFAKIIMVCDVYDALTHDRVYKSKISPFDAAEYISWNSGQLFDTRMCYMLLSHLAEYYSGKEVKLNTGHIGRIIYVDANYPTKPIVQLGGRFIDLSKDPKYKIVELL